MNKMYDLSVVMGSKNRKNLLKATINSIRTNGFNGNIDTVSAGTSNKISKCQKREIKPLYNN